MVSSKLTVEELLRIANSDVSEAPPSDDMEVFIYEHGLDHGEVKINKRHLYIYYRFWSKSPCIYKEFCDKLVSYIRNNVFYVNNCIDINVLEREVLLERKKEIEKKRSR